MRPPAPISLRNVIASFATTSARDEAMVLYDSEFTVTLLRGAAPGTPSVWTSAVSEVFLYVLQGSLAVVVRPSALTTDAEAETFVLRAEDVFLIPTGYAHILQVRT